MPKWLIILLIILLIIVVGCCGGFVMCTYVLKKTGESVAAKAGMAFGSLPASFPKDVPVYSGFTPTFSVAPPGSDAGTTTFSGKEDPAKVGEFYDKQMTSDGWTKTADSSIGGGVTQSFTKDDREVTISAHGNSSEATLNIEWNKKGGTRPGGEPADHEETPAPARPGGEAGAAGGGGAGANAGGNDAPAPRNTVTVGGGKLPANFPSDVPVYSGLTPMPMGSFADKMKGSGVAQLSGRVDKDKTEAYYEQQLKDKGWKQESNQDFGAGTIMIYSKDKRKLSVQIVPDSDKGETLVTISYEQSQE
jgi:hypothetical protein